MVASSWSASIRMVLVRMGIKPKYASTKGAVVYPDR